MYLGLRSVIYPAPDLPAARAWFAGLLGVDPYFDEPFYVGFALGGYELGLDPDAPLAQGPITYWGVDDVDAALAAALAAGATPNSPVTEVGGGIALASYREPGGSIVGVIRNPNFATE
jgi:catechol 2,3-dioxygenase-like lactoylglutathione lyase family enzyme